MLRYEDFVDGDRLKRVYAALLPGSSALTAVLFFDSINRDKKGDTYIYLFRVFVLRLFLNCVLMMIVSMSVLMYVLKCY